MSTKLFNINDLAIRNDNQRVVRIAEANPVGHRVFYVTRDKLDGHTTIIEHRDLRPFFEGSCYFVVRCVDWFLRRDEGDAVWTRDERYAFRFPSKTEAKHAIKRLGAKGCVVDAKGGVE